VSAPRDWTGNKQNAPVQIPKPAWRWLGLRDRLLASPRFQRWASRLPLTRPIANRRARELFDITAGFVYSQVLAACVQLRLLEQLAPGPLPLPAIATACGLPQESAARLLAAAAALRLVQERGDECYGLGDLGAALLGNPAVAAMVSHHSALYGDLADPVALLRDRSSARLARFWPYAGSAGELAPEEPVAAYSELMATSQALIAEDILDAVSLKRYRRLLDIAGGDGAFCAAALTRWPQLQATVFDLPAVARRARQRFLDAGLDPRGRVQGGNLWRDRLPRGADIATLIRVLHDHDDLAVDALLQSAHQALPAGGRLLIAEPMAATPGAEPMAAYFGMYLWAMGSGRPRTARELTQRVLGAGFHRCREVPTHRPLLVRVLVAEA
jgi:demethylspheroidene O-methyltransferase